MSKTIDVEKGDTWTADTKDKPFFMQHRDGKHRQVSRSTVSRWYDNCVEWPPISSWVAVGILDAWGYTITTPAAKDEATAKTEPTPDVPMVGDIWVEHDGVLSGYSQWNKMHALHGYEIRNGTARIVRLAPDADLAATVKRVEDTVTQLDKAAFDFDERLSKLEAATTPAKVRVVAPTTPDTAPMTNERFHGWSEGWCQSDERWRAALSAAGVEVKEAGQ